MKTSPLKLALIPVLMYDVICDITGLNGKTGRIQAAEVTDPVDRSRTIEVRFLANTSSGLPWDFEPLVKKMEIHPGQVYEAMYRVRSTSRDKTLGQAIPSVSPGTLRDTRYAAAICRRQGHIGQNRTDYPFLYVLRSGTGIK